MVSVSVMVSKNVMHVEVWTTFSSLIEVQICWHSVDMNSKSSRKWRRKCTYNYSVESNGLLWLSE